MRKAYDAVSLNLKMCKIILSTSYKDIRMELKGAFLPEMENTDGADRIPLGKERHR